MVLHCRISAAFALVAATLCACGDDAGPDAGLPVDASAADALAPTGDLIVSGTFVVDNDENVTSGSALRVDIELFVALGQQPVTAATVAINPAIPSFQTVLAPDPLVPGRWFGNYLGYYETAKISVTTNGAPHTTGEILLQGPVLGNMPAAGLIEQPAAGASVVAGQDLHISWSKPEGTLSSADVALAVGSSGDGYTMAALPDTGVFDIPGDEIVVGDDTLTLVRWRDNPLGPGAAPGSLIRFGLKAQADFTVMSP